MAHINHPVLTCMYGKYIIPIMVCCTYIIVRELSTIIVTGWGGGEIEVATIFLEHLRRGGGAAFFKVHRRQFWDILPKNARQYYRMTA